MRVNNKKSIALLLVIAILASFIPNLTSYAASPSITFKQITTGDLSKGSSVTVEMNLSDGLADQNALGFCLNYDKSKIAIDTIAFSKVVASSSISQSDPGTELFAIGGSEEETLRTSGKLATITFIMLEDGTANFSITDAKYSKYIEVDGAKDSEDTPVTFNTNFSLQTTVLVSGITLSPTLSTVGVGKSTKLTASVLPENATESKTVTWSSDNKNIASVDGAGNVTGIAPGTANITATVKTASGTFTSQPCVVTVDNPITSIKLSKSTNKIESGKSFTLTTTIEPSNTTDSKSVLWSSSDDNIAYVDQNGNVTAVSNGTTTIKAVVAGKEDTCEVTVFTPITGLNIDKSSLALNKGEIAKVTATKAPVEATEGGDITYDSSNKTVATVDSEGNVTAVNKGTAIISAKCGPYSAICNVVVTVEVDSILLKAPDGTENAITLNKTQSTTLTATVLPADANTKAVTWSSSDESVVSVINGSIKALKPGNAIIYATSENGVAGQMIVNVPEVTSTQIVMSEPTNFEMNIGTSRTLTASLIPDDTTDEINAVWSSSDESVVKIEMEGLKAKLTAVSAGKATIKASSNGHETSVDVNVVIPLSSISISKTTLDMMSDDVSEPLTITKTPTDATADVSEVTWMSLNEKVATIDSNGVVTAHESGIAKIKGVLGDKIVICTVTVKTKLEGVSIGNGDATSYSIVRKKDTIIGVVYTPTYATEIPMATWTIEDENIAKIISTTYAMTGATDTVTVKGINPGKTNIVLDYGNGVKATREIVVTEIPSTGILIDTEFDELAVNATSEPLSATLYPGESTDDCIWTVSDEEIAKVEMNDEDKPVLKGLKEGTVTLTVTAGNTSYKQSMDVKITLKKIVSLKAAIEGEVVEGTTTQLNVEVTPPDASEEKVYTYASENESIAMVDENGLITALKPGETVITVTHANGINTQMTLRVLSKTGENPTPTPTPTPTPSNTAANNVINKNITTGGNSVTNTNSASNVVATPANTTNTTTAQKVTSVISPATGDINIFVIVGLMIVSLAGMIYIIKKK